ncbi:ABC-F type ribosomal protection protein [Bacillus sp. BRMEA1]|uniref:ribosomal protection-like ABC-F family protein n=1 Tax=Neobacillus endophyticus TaxID=2738405 RepID=UPI001565004E|nr:ABC-F type ribosomal protection protein [Neobacillus endophyticus]NRD78065.1 ABC-F type ribosomal protection protein [Neobacillus endophyticus]
MWLLKVENVQMNIDGMSLFENASLEVKENERVALIGENGVGKTTFIKGILGIAVISQGNIEWNINKEEIGVMLQDSENDTELSTREWVEKADAEKSKLKNELNGLAGMLASPGKEERILKEYQICLQRYLDLNGYDWEVEVSKILKQLGLDESIWGIPYKGLSGGQKTRAKLAKAMMYSPKLLILDEPTNHLDMESVEWLQRWLKRYKGSVLFTSHEREFIDQVADVTCEIKATGTKKYHGGYTYYRAQKDHEIKTVQALYEKQEQERRKLIDAIQNFKNWYQQANASASVRNPYAQKQAAKQASKYKAKEKALKRLEESKVEKPSETKSINANFGVKDFLAKKMLEMSEVGFSYNDHMVFRNINLQVQRGDRIAIIGKNGSGKTTLLKLMTGQLAPDHGELSWNPQLNIGYFFQELENLNEENTVLEELLLLPNLTQSEARTILACFLFRKDEVLKKIKHLSMGEKCRVAFVKLYFSEANLLILDEPTNYLDIETRERIEEALVSYPGSIVIVSHDPYLLRKVANKVIKVDNRQVLGYSGSYSEWEKHTIISPQIQKHINQLKVLEIELLDLLNEEADPEGIYPYNKIKEKKLKIEEIRQEIEKANGVKE